MSQSSPQKSGCLGILFFLIFVVPFLFSVVPFLISELIAVFQGQAKVGLKNCSVRVGEGISVGCIPEITPKYQFFNITNLESKKNAITTSIQEFHTHISQDQCQKIYEKASDLLKKDITQTDFLKDCDRIHQALGTGKSFELVGWEWLPFDENSNEYIRVYSKASFSKLTINEMLIWQIRDNQPSLFAYYWQPNTAKSK
ncbi:hypothetical protein ACE1AT_12160 [Pelatocladus sp. BLCC-F211]|uniref:hypothetical protein n=1 Tax=Pelatocladus sp. BLCC-F211 TaxID=3342752 RepID=UPI0035B8EF5D